MATVSVMTARGADDIGQLYREALETAGRAAASDDWLGKLRAEALATAMGSGLPDRRHEDWRYTDLEEFARRSAAYLQQPDPAAAAARATAARNQRRIPGWKHPVITVIDGRPTAADLATLSGIAGLHVGTLTATADADRDRVAALLAAGDPGPADGSTPLVALNTALLADALVLRTEPGARLPTPLLVSFIGTGSAVPALPRLLVDLADGSSLTLVIRHVADGPALVNAVTQIRCGRDSRLRIVRIQETSAETLLVENSRLDLAANAEVDVTTVDVGARLSRHDLDISLAGTGATSSVHGLFFTDGERHVDNHTRVDHRVPRTTSSEIFRGIIDGSGRGVFNGKIVVHPGAAKADAALTNRNLLLTRSAEIDTKPELEIYHDDVRCSHGATTGQLDPAALFYLRTRGIEPAEARRLLITAFALEVFESVEDETLRAHLDRLLEKHLAGATLASTALAGANPAAPGDHR